MPSRHRACQSESLSGSRFGVVRVDWGRDICCFSSHIPRWTSTPHPATKESTSAASRHGIFVLFSISKIYSISLITAKLVYVGPQYSIALSRIPLWLRFLYFLFTLTTTRHHSLFVGMQERSRKSALKRRIENSFCCFVGWPSSTLLLLFTMYLIVQTNMELNRHISEW